jgi:hypothetical protein
MNIYVPAHFCQIEKNGSCGTQQAAGGAGSFHLPATRCRQAGIFTAPQDFLDRQIPIIVAVYAMVNEGREKGFS